MRKKLHRRESGEFIFWSEPNTNADLFEKIVRNVCSVNRRYAELMLKEMGKEYFEYPLIHNERGQYSSWAVAIDKLTKLHMSECGIKKKAGGYGRADMWFWRKKSNFLFELKQRSISYGKSTGKMKDLKTTWKEMCGQVDKNLNQIKRWGEGGTSFGMLNISTYLSEYDYNRFNRDEINDDIEPKSFLKERIIPILNKKPYKPNWYAQWSPPEIMRKTYYDGDKNSHLFRYRPNFYFLCYARPSDK